MMQQMIRNGRIEGNLVDISIRDGLIQAIAPAYGGDILPGELDLQEGLIWPCFVDLHTHLDKCHIWSRSAGMDGRFHTSIAAVERDKAAHWSVEDLRQRMDFGLRCAYRHGTKAIRTHLDCAPGTLPSLWEVFDQMSEMWTGRIALQAVALAPIETFRDRSFAERLADRVAASAGVLGAFLYPTADLPSLLDLLFDLAERRTLDLDLHVDESDNTEISTLELLAHTAIRRRFAGTIVAGHCCSLSLMDPLRAARIIDLVADAGIAIVSLPSTNLHIQDRTPGRTPRWRGITLIKELVARGISVSVASDNVRDPFYAFGDYDLFDVFRLATLTGQLDYPLEPWPACITTTPAAVMGATAAPLAIGQPADLILFSARNCAELIARPQSERIVLRGGVRLTEALPDPRDLERP